VPLVCSYYGNSIEISDRIKRVIKEEGSNINLKAKHYPAIQTEEHDTFYELTRQNNQRENQIDQTDILNDYRLPKNLIHSDD